LRRRSCAGRRARERPGARGGGERFRAHDFGLTASVMTSMPTFSSGELTSVDRPLVEPIATVIGTGLPSRRIQTFPRDVLSGLAAPGAWPGRPPRPPPPNRPRGIRLPRRPPPE